MTNESDEKGEQPDLMIQQLVSVERVSLNVSQSVVVTTEDKLRLCLKDYLSEAERGKEWIAPLSLLIALLLALVSADFHDALLPAATWHAIFVISAVLSLLWLLLALRRAFRAQSIDALIEEIQANANVPSDDDAKEQRR